MGHSHLLHRGLLHGLQRGDLLYLGLMGAGGQPAPPGASPQGAGELVLHAWSTSCPPAALTLVPAGLVLTPSSATCSCAAGFLPFLNMLSQMYNQHRFLAQLWPAAGPFFTV